VFWLGAYLAYNKIWRALFDPGKEAGMFLDIHELEREAIDFEQHLPPGHLDLGKEFSHVEPLDFRGSAELVASEVRLSGFLRTVVKVSCARCLETFPYPVEVTFDLSYRPVQTIARSEEVEMKRSEMNVGFFQGDGFLLEDAIREQILLAIPMKTICRPNCAGLCPQCGQNLNVAACNCRSLTADDRWAPLARFRQ
jgi:uncharacterized protein